VDTATLATSFGARLPAWVVDELADVPETLATDEDRVRLTNRLASRNHREDTGGPFAALVVDSATGRLVSAGVNVVLASGLSSTHAEVVALSLAQTRLGRWNLGAAGDPALELVVNWRPCVMCYGAAMWSGIKRLLIAGDGPELEALTGFDEGPLGADWAEQFEARGISVTQGVLRDEAIAVFAEYGARTDAVVYNAR
jgi:tRNA(Arg) A34 adenosine deaminase TadA